MSDIDDDAFVSEEQRKKDKSDKKCIASLQLKIEEAKKVHQASLGVDTLVLLSYPTRKIVLFYN